MHRHSLYFFYSNRISAITPSQPSNLTELSLAHNVIRELSPETFSNSFPNLTYLNLQGNQISSVEELALPLSLLELNLGKNIKKIEKSKPRQTVTLKIYRAFYRIQSTQNHSKISTSKFGNIILKIEPSLGITST